MLQRGKLRAGQRTDRAVQGAGFRGQKAAASTGHIIQFYLMAFGKIVMCKTNKKGRENLLQLNIGQKYQLNMCIT